MSVQSAGLEQTGKPSQTSTIWAALFVLMALLLTIAVFNEALRELLHRWNKQEEYSHGFLVPVVAAWLLWTRREAIRASVGRPAWAGFTLILLATGMHVLGELSAIFIFSQVGFIVALLGIVLGFGGHSLFKVTFVPIVFLAFAIPLPYFIDSTLTLQLQLISSEIGVFFIRLFQVPVYLDGNIIDLGTYKLLVVEACSGLRYLYPLLSLGFLAAYMFQAPIWQRGVVFLSTIPITIGMNGFRIGMVGVTVDRWGSEAAGEFLHFFEGWIIFLVCSALLAAEIYVLARLSGRRFFQAFHFPQVGAHVPHETSASSMSRVPLMAGLLILYVVAFAVSSVSSRAEIVPERTRFAAFPARIGQWQGHTALLEPEIETGLGLDDYILSDFTRSDGKGVNLYVAFYASQRKGISPHSPLVCMPGGGWQITKFERTSYANLDTQLPLNRAIIERDSKREVVYYWFDERGRKIANEYWAKWYLLTDAIVKNRSDGALVRLTTPILPTESEHDADERLRSFLREVVPSLAQYLPSDTATATHVTPVANRRNGQS